MRLRPFVKLYLEIVLHVSAWGLSQVNAFGAMQCGIEFELLQTLNGTTSFSEIEKRAFPFSLLSKSDFCSVLKRQKRENSKVM